VHADDGSRLDVDGQLAERMIADGDAQFLVGPYGASSVAAAAAVADRHHVALVSANGSAGSIFGRRAVRTGIPDAPAEPPKLPATGVPPAAG
jgi:ABC-type branched-subunit amino acid transport system substrate-binding protein